MSGIKGKEYPYIPNMVGSHIHCVNRRMQALRVYVIGRRLPEKEAAHIMIMQRPGVNAFLGSSVSQTFGAPGGMRSAGFILVTW